MHDMHDMPIPPKSISEHNSRSIRNGIIGEKYAEICYETTVCQNALILSYIQGPCALFLSIQRFRKL